MGARDLLVNLADAGFSITADGDSLVIRPASKLTDPLRAALRDAKPDLLALLAGAKVKALSFVTWTDDDIARFTACRARLLRWGWPDADAEKLAERLVRRDRETDTRVSCTDCCHYRPGHCGNHRRAGLCVPDVGRDLAGMLQRCPGHQPRKE